MMDITAFSPTQKNNPVGRSSSTGTNTNEVDGLASQRTDRDGDKDNSVAQDSATISSEALKLSSTSFVKQATNQTQIPDRQKAQEAASSIISAIQSNPAQAQNAFGNASPSRAVNALG